MIFRSSRIFKAWQYTVSHSMLLLRSPMDNGYVTNIDLVFGGVLRIELDMDDFEGLTISELSRVGENVWYEIVSNGSVGKILAASFREYENTRELFDSGFD